MSETGGLPLWQVMAADPAIPMDAGTLRLVISDQRRPSRALLYPWIRVLSRVAVTLIVVGKRLCPAGSPRTPRWTGCACGSCAGLSPRRRFPADQALHRGDEPAELLRGERAPARRRGGRPAPGHAGRSRQPRRDRARLNVYRVLFALGRARGAARPRDALDFAMLEVPEVDPEHGTRRLLNLGIQTALCLMNIPFAFCLTPAEYRRAVHSPASSDRAPPPGDDRSSAGARRCPRSRRQQCRRPGHGVARADL